MEFREDEKVNEKNKSKLVFDEQVIQKIVSTVIKGTEGVTTIKSGGAFSGIVGRVANESISVEVGETEVAVDLRLLLKFGENAKNIYDTLKKEIEEKVFDMTGLKVVEVNVRVEDVLNDDEFKAKIEG